MIDRNDSYASNDLPGASIESLQCGTCGQPAASWNYVLGADADGNDVIDGFAVCAAHKATHKTAAA